MPELPEVEIARRCLASWARGQRVKRVEVRDRRVVVGGARRLATLVGGRFEVFDRHGKHLMLTLRQGRAQVLGLLSHLGMTGKWLLRQRGEEPPRFSRVQIDLERGAELHYADLRLFGRLQVVPGAEFQQVRAIAALGPDPLRDGVDPRRLAEKSARSSLPIKPWLLDQRIAAGVGNIQASEALFRARIDPRRLARRITVPEWKTLARAIVASIDFTLRDYEKEIAASGGREIRYVEEPSSVNPFKVYDRAGDKCPRCRQGIIVRLVQAGRSSFYCPRCQK